MPRGECEPCQHHQRCRNLQRIPGGDPAIQRSSSFYHECEHILSFSFWLRLAAPQILQLIVRVHGLPTSFFRISSASRSRILDKRVATAPSESPLISPASALLKPSRCSNMSCRSTP